jgi:hypothetical protein
LGIFHEEERKKAVRSQCGHRSSRVESKRRTRNAGTMIVPSRVLNAFSATAEAKDPSRQATRIQ